jgi:hypothetical protein
MSEYQIYEFQSVDRPLTPEERQQIRQLSSRVDPTSHRAVFTYSHGDFRGDPLNALATYFDSMYYIANFGVQQLAFRFPKALLDTTAIAPYLFEGCIRLITKGEWYILEFSYSTEEGFGWLEEQNMLPDLINLRQEILNQDYRGLYLAWLKLVTLKLEETYHDFELEDEDIEPPVPPGLQKLSTAQAAFAQTFEIDPALLTAAQQASDPLTASTSLNWQRAIAQLSPEQQHSFLVRLASGETNLTAKLQKVLRPLLEEQSTTIQEQPRRSVKTLLEMAAVEQEKAARLAKEKAKAERIKALQKLTPQASRLWQEVEEVMRDKKGHSYGKAVELLQDLRDLAVLQREEIAFEARLHKLSVSYPPTPALAKRLKQAKLL